MHGICEWDRPPSISEDFPNDSLVERWFCSDMYDNACKIGDLAAAIGWASRTPGEYWVPT